MKHSPSIMKCYLTILPESFQSYLDEVLESVSSSGKTVYIMGDFNITLLNFETWKFTKNLLLSLQSYSFFATIDKPTRVYDNSASLIDNILANTICTKITRLSGSIISGISYHYSQICIVESSYQKPDYPQKKVMMRDFSRFSGDEFNTELLQVNWELILSRQRNVHCAFSTFYNKPDEKIRLTAISLNNSPSPE